MVRISVALFALFTAIGLAQTDVPRPMSNDTAAKSFPDHSFIVFFEGQNGTLTPQAKEILLIAAGEVRAMPESKVRVVFPSDLSIRLSQSRARAVTTELIYDGVKPRSIVNAAEQPSNTYAYPELRAWQQRSAVIQIMPLAIANGDGRVG